jgi:hypothetical protein
MTEHIHGCLICRPDMVPDFSRDDPHYHDGQKCANGWLAVTVNGEPIAYTIGMYEGAEGWVLYAGYPAENVHPCPNHFTYLTTTQGEPYLPIGAWDHICVEPRFGRVEVDHICQP